jgi:hypothetical protein
VEPGHRRTPILGPAIPRSRSWTAARCGAAAGTRPTSPSSKKLDGSGYVELPTGSAISPAGDGRLAHYTYKQTAQGSESIVWDMSTGRAAAFPVFGSSAPVSRGGGRDFTAWEQDGKMLLLDFQKLK